MPHKTAVTTDRAPAPKGQYSQAVKAGPFIYVAGQVASDFTTGLASEVRIQPGFPYYGVPMKLQTDYILRHIAKVLEAAGSSLYHTPALWAFLTDIVQAPHQWEVRKDRLKRPPANSTLGIRRLAVTDALIEIDCISVAKDGPYRCEVIETHRAPAPPRERYPQAVKAGPFVFVSGQAATDFVHGVAPPARMDPRFPFFGREIKRQTAYILDNIRAVLEAAGSSLDQVVKALIFLERSADFPGLEEVWRAYFPKDPPARSIVPARPLIPGCRVEVQAIAVVPDGRVKKEVVVTDRAPRPTIHQPQAINTGDLVFLSGLMATDFRSPLAPEARVNPAFPNHGVGIKRQMEYILDTADTILRACGSSLDHVVRRQNYLLDFAAEMPAFREVTRARFGYVPPASTTIEVVGEFIIPACTVMLDLMAVIPGD